MRWCTDAKGWGEWGNSLGMQQPTFWGQVGMKIGEQGADEHSVWRAGNKQHNNYHGILQA